MRKQILGLALASSVTLGGCATTGGTGPSVADIVAQTQQIAVQVCAFLPTATTIIEIISVSGSSLSTASAIANAICVAVRMEARQARRSGAPIIASVRGVVVRGKFVN